MVEAEAAVSSVQCSVFSVQSQPRRVGTVAVAVRIKFTSGMGVKVYWVHNFFSLASFFLFLYGIHS